MLVGGVAGLSLVGAGRAQTHVVKKPETVVRAVAVYEFTGEPGKVTASRVVPVSVFINGQFEDGGIYMARPVPFALDNGTIFEVEKAGAPEGTVELSYERHVQTAGAVTLEDGWLGYGKFKPKPMETLGGGEEERAAAAGSDEWRGSAALCEQAGGRGRGREG